MLQRGASGRWCWRQYTCQEVRQGQGQSRRRVCWRASSGRAGGPGCARELRERQQRKRSARAPARARGPPGSVKPPRRRGLECLARLGPCCAGCSAAPAARPTARLHRGPRGGGELRRGGAEGATAAAAAARRGSSPGLGRPAPPGGRRRPRQGLLGPGPGGAPAAGAERRRRRDGRRHPGPAAPTGARWSGATAAPAVAGATPAHRAVCETC
mmetsp:Transcript_108818/g.336114  ORF Transcript_108818/g.336114 Transcript_108818/m.336114 type:complete len:213 (-) Transcript_108818:285-923(-)